MTFRLLFILLLMFKLTLTTNLCQNDISSNDAAYRISLLSEYDITKYRTRFSISEEMVHSLYKANNNIFPEFWLLYHEYSFHKNIGFWHFGEKKFKAWEDIVNELLKELKQKD